MIGCTGFEVHAILVEHLGLRDDDLLGPYV